ncbi:MAG: hypothetical protein ACE5GA_07920 [Candidatus Zixiibacteriota bacterium]
MESVRGIPDEHIRETSGAGSAYIYICSDIVIFKIGQYCHPESETRIT